MTPEPWPFSEPTDLAVYTTRQVLDEGAPIGLISHDLDGDWQFLHAVEEADEADERSIDDLMIVHLFHIVEWFPHVADYADLPIGWIAWLDEGGTWVREPRPPEWDELE